MKKFPREIVVSITERLTFRDKLELAYVCKKWYDILSETTLYSKLIFKKEWCLEEAIEMFDKKQQQIKQHVRHLVLLEFEFDMKLALALPSVFPNITSLEWKVDNRQPPIIMEGSDKTTYTQALQQWKNLETLVDCTYYLNIATHLLENTRCNSLTLLQVSFDFSDMVPNRMIGGGLLQELIKNIHNAPSLAHVYFRNTPIRLTDMEDLHGSLPQLTTLVLEDIYLYQDDSISDMTPLSQKSLQLLSLLNFAIWFRGRQDPSNALCNWMSYIGASYNNFTRAHFRLQ